MFITAYMESRKVVLMNLLQGRNGDADIEKGQQGKGHRSGGGRGE